MAGMWDKFHGLLTDEVRAKPEDYVLRISAADELELLRDPELSRVGAFLVSLITKHGRGALGKIYGVETSWDAPETKIEKKVQ